ncbi:glycosyltransferase family 1 protein [Periconia macrospinosa]|uniref:Glycosyltransferase family 1 protein n=1 Tax=Periconia macrospinosa TaxID=97972 RepID=A0A2V1DY67_9PLEO|nr:glycosyltransferase family 1 protein [Periconia macrospinosa]
MKSEKSKESDPPQNETTTAWYEPPPYEIHSSGKLLASTCTLKDDGTLDIDFASSAPDELANALPEYQAVVVESKPPATLHRQCPPLNVVVQVVGSRGDVQPFIALGMALQRYGHRVRLATHDVFADFVRKSGLEFYPIGGDPEDLMSYMVRNPGLLPSLESLKGGDIPRKRRMIYEMLKGCWKSCVCPDPVTQEPFVANAIIANPPSFAHVHCGQALGVPVHIMFTMPWTATRAFPHPLTNVKARNIRQSNANYCSYGMVNMLTWQGSGDVINKWRVEDLQMDPVHTSMGPDLIETLKIPFTYCWSPALVPKPNDWGSNIDICGFFMRDEPVFTPPDDLVSFLRAGPMPVYIGFGSIVLESATKMTEIILEACKMAGVRALVSRGWSKLGGDNSSTGDVFYLEDCPHEWLFKQVQAVVHHGGAGTTACGLYNARPTVIVPFFGDQPFWGHVVASNGAGPIPIRHQSLTSQNLADAIKFCLTPGAQQAAQAVADQMLRENGVNMAVQSFHHHLNMSDMTCDIDPQHAADWMCRKPKSKTCMKVSHAALKDLITSGQVKVSDAVPHRPKEYNMDIERWDPVSGGVSAFIGVMTDVTSAIGGTFVNPFREYKKTRFAGGNGGEATLSAAAAMGKGVASMGTSVTKGTLVGVPMAFAEGFRNAPKLYGDDIMDHGTVEDWKSGGVVAAKTFGTGFYEGITDIVTKPYAGAKKEGALGFMKGLGKGSMNMVTKPGSAMFGLVAYPAQGIYKSMKTLRKSTVESTVRSGKLASLERCNPSLRARQ